MQRLCILIDIYNHFITQALKWLKFKPSGTFFHGSVREIDMSQPVFDALKEQFKKTSDYNFVFCNRNGEPLNANNDISLKYLFM
jgi:hypothetical protein